MDNNQRGFIQAKGTCDKPTYTHIRNTAKQVGCSVSCSDFLTRVRVSGTHQQLLNFMNSFNNQSLTFGVM